MKSIETQQVIEKLAHSYQEQPEATLSASWEQGVLAQVALLSRESKSLAEQNWCNQFIWRLAIANAACLALFTHTALSLHSYMDYQVSQWFLQNSTDALVWQLFM